MATGSIREKPLKHGISYQIVIEGGYDELTGKRIRIHKNVKCSKREAKSIMHRMITEMEQGKLTQRSNKKVGAWMDEWVDNYLPNTKRLSWVSFSFWLC